MNELKVTLACGISIDFTGKLDEQFNFIGTFSEMLNEYKTGKNDEIRNGAIIEIENRAMKYAHEAFAGYIMRARMANEAVKLLLKKLSE